MFFGRKVFLLVLFINFMRPIFGQLNRNLVLMLFKLSEIDMMGTTKIKEIRKKKSTIERMLKINKCVVLSVRLSL